MLLTILSVTILASITWVFFWKASRARLAPGPVGLPLLGNMLSLDAQMHTALHKMHLKFGSLVSLKLASMEAVFIADSRLAHQAFVKHGAKTNARVPLTSLMQASGPRKLAYIAHNEDLPRIKQLTHLAVRHLLGQKQVDEGSVFLNQAIATLLPHLQQAAMHGEPIPIRPLMKLNSLNSISSPLFGISFPGADDPLCQRIIANFEQQFEALVMWPGDFHPLLKLTSTHRTLSKKLAAIVEERDTILDTLLDRTQAAAANGDVLAVESFCSKMLEQGVDRSEVASLCNTMFAAGFDTSSTTLDWAVLYLVNNPHLQQRAQRQIDQVLARGAVPNKDDLARLPLVWAIVKETLRQRHVAPFGLPHLASEDFELDGHLIRKNTAIFYNHYSSAHLGRFQQSERFAPERWLDAAERAQLGIESDLEASATSATRWSVTDTDFAPFSFGSRMCPGYQMAIRTMVATLTSMLQQFSFHSPTGRPLPETAHFGLTLQPDRYQVRVSRRHSLIRRSSSEAMIVAG